MAFNTVWSNWVVSTSTTDVKTEEFWGKKFYRFPSGELIELNDFVGYARAAGSKYLEKLARKLEKSLR